MNLKEAFRYQNYIDNLMCHAQSYLSNRAHTIEVQQTHKRSAVDPDAKDEVLTSEQLYPARGTHYDVNHVVCFLLALQSEKEALTSAITKAKHDADFQLDAEIALNKSRQTMAKSFQTLANMKTMTRIVPGNGRRFNAEGNQVVYAYDIEEKQELAFDPIVIRGLSKALMAKSDMISNDAERCLLTTEVDLYPFFNVNDTYEEALEAYIANNPVAEIPMN